MSFGLCNSANNEKISGQQVKENFEDLHHPLDLLQAKTEASRCLYCYDAPCITACPTSIAIPTFIHQIRTENIKGSAKTILSENIMGGTCARACPTEILCEQACVLNKSLQRPVEIGSLQRFAVDTLLSDESLGHPFERADSSGKRVAIIGAGPAGLSCAHRCAMLGHSVTVYESSSKPGGLNEYGLAAYKMVDNFAQKEIEFLLDIGGISVEYGKSLGVDYSIDALKSEFDSVFVAVGLGRVNELGIVGENNEKVLDAISFIESIRQAKDKSKVNVGENVIVIGAGNTAIDAAIQAKRLGANNVTLVYRRGESSMSATQWEIDLARRNQVKIVLWASPSQFNANNSTLEFNQTSLKDGKLVLTGKTFSLTTDMVLSAIGQKMDEQFFDNSRGRETLSLSAGKIEVSENYETSIEGVFAGGDCIKGDDLTVQAVQDGKQAAHAINEYLSEQGA